MTATHGGALLHAFEGLRRWRRKSQAIAYRRHAIAELEALDDRILEDIGVNRRSIRDLVDAQLQFEAETGAEPDAADPRPAPARPGLAARPCVQPC